MHGFSNYETKKDVLNMSWKAKNIQKPVIKDYNIWSNELSD